MAFSSPPNFTAKITRSAGASGSVPSKYTKGQASPLASTPSARYRAARAGSVMILSASQPSAVPICQPYIVPSAPAPATAAFLISIMPPFRGLPPLPVFVPL